MQASLYHKSGVRWRGQGRIRYPTGLKHLPGTLFLRNLVGRRALLVQLVRRDFEQRYVGSAAGWLWGVIHPLVLLVCYIFVFQICLRIPPPQGAVTHNYAVYFFCGFLPWLLFQETVMRSSTAVVEHANLITKTIFPAEVIPVAVFLSALISHLLTLGIVVIVVAVWLKHFSLMVLLLPVYMVLLGLLAIGVSWVASSLHVYLRDTAQVVTVIMTLWFWVTPILIYEDLYPARLRFLLSLNPLAYLVRAYRDRLLSYQLPGLRDLAVLAGFGICSFVAGGLIFRHLKRGFADVL